MVKFIVQFIRTALQHVLLHSHLVPKELCGKFIRVRHCCETETDPDLDDKKVAALRARRLRIFFRVSLSWGL